MATAQAVRTEEKTGSWASMFPVEQVTEQQSTLFAKKLMAVAISNITYLRAIFPERAYGDRCLGDLNLKILRDDSSCPGASQVIKWVKGCFDALDKKYLRMVIIGIYVDPEDPNTVIESYTFKFSYSAQCGVDVYHNGQKVSSLHTTEKTKKETIQMLRTIIVLTQSLQPLPDNVMMTMKLLYYDEVTPPEYEPPGFKPSDQDTFRFEEEALNIKLGDVSTPFHSIKMRIKTDKKQFDIRDNDGEETGKEQTISNSGLDKEQDYDHKQEKGRQTNSASDTSVVCGALSCSEKADIPLVSPGMPDKSRGEHNIKDTSLNGDKFKVQSPRGSNEVAQMTEKTANINLNSRQFRATTLAQRESSKIRGPTTRNSPAGMDGQNKRGKKRAFSKVDETAFDISNSQDCNETCSRKRKSSDVKKSIVV